MARVKVTRSRVRKLRGEFQFGDITVGWSTGSKKNCKVCLPEIRPNVINLLLPEIYMPSQTEKERVSGFVVLFCGLNWSSLGCLLMINANLT